MTSTVSRSYVGQVLLDRVTPKTNDVVQLFNATVRKAQTTNRWDLSKMELDAMPPILVSLTALTTLALNDNILTNIPVDIFVSLTNLVHLRLQNNQLIEIPQELGNLSKLQSLWLGFNKITSLPDTVSSLANLTMLALSSNQLTRLPLSLAHCSSLTAFSFDVNPLEVPCKEIQEQGHAKLLNYMRTLLTARHTRELELRKIGILSVPVEIQEEWMNLVSLNLSENRIPFLPESISLLSSLRSLVMEGCKLKEAPVGIAQLSQLRTLSFKNNLIEYIPWEYAKNLEYLSEFDISGNPEIVLPPPEIAGRGMPYSLKYLRALSDACETKALDLRDWQLRDLASVEKMRLCGGPVHEFEKITLASNALGELPEVVLHMTSLTSLNISANVIQAFPPDMLSLGAVRSIVASANRLVNIDSIVHCRQLTSLDLSRNAIVSLPIDIDELFLLKRLSLSSNKLRELPVEIGGLIQLTFLDLSFNRLAALPTTMSALVQLEVLRLSRNKIVEAPTIIFSLPNLRELLLGNNRLELISPELQVALRKIQVIDLVGNPLSKQFAMIEEEEEEEEEEEDDEDDDEEGGGTTTGDEFGGGGRTSESSGGESGSVTSTSGRRRGRRGGGDQDSSRRASRASSSASSTTGGGGGGSGPPSRFRIHRQHSRSKQILRSQGSGSSSSFMIAAASSASPGEERKSITASAVAAAMLRSGSMSGSANSSSNVLGSAAGAASRRRRDTSGSELALDASSGGEPSRRGTMELVLGRRSTNNSDSFFGPGRSNSSLGLLGDSSSSRRGTMNSLGSGDETSAGGGGSRRRRMNNNNNNNYKNTLKKKKKKKSPFNAAELSVRVFQLAIAGLITQRLDLSLQSMPEMPRFVPAMTGLTWLNLSKCGMTELDGSIGRLTNLLDLQLQENKLTFLPPSIGNLTALQKLNLNSNSLSRLPQSLGALQSQLVEFDVSNNPLISPPAEVVEGGGPAILRFLKRLLTASVTGRMQASAMNLRVSAPSEIYALTLLTHLFLDKNELVTLEPKLQDLTGLVVLSADLNKLTDISAPLQGEWRSPRFPNLKELRLRGNRIREIPQEIRRLTALEILALTNNEIQEFPVELAMISRLQRLYLSHNCIPELPARVANMQSLTILDLSYNLIAAVPFEMGRLMNQLEEFSVANNPPLASPPRDCARVGGHDVLEFMWHLHLASQQRSLDWSRRMLLRVPSELTEFPQLRSLTSLNLERNFLKDIPLQVSKLMNLKVFLLAHNRLQMVPLFVPMMTQLVDISLSSNPIKDLPLTLGDLTELKRLAIANMPLLEVPPFEIQTRPTRQVISYLRKFRKLQSGVTQKLNLSKLEMSAWPTRGLTEERVATCLTELRLADNNIEELPPQLKLLVRLRALDADQNLLATLPKEIEDLPELQVLSACRNRIVVLPPITTTSLKHLVLNENYIEQLPPEIGTWNALRSVSLKKNLLRSLPPEARGWKRLTTLDLTSNQLTAFPPCLPSLTALTSVNLDENAIKTIPSNIRQCSWLCSLSLHGNRIAILDPALGKLPRLEHLGFDAEHVQFPPSEVASASLARILQYLNVLDTGVTNGHVDLSNWNFLAFPLEGSTVRHLMSRITRLGLASNLLQQIPGNSLQEFVSLRCLDLSFNKLETIPPEIERLSGSLRELLLPGNRLIDFPGNIASLTRLTLLNASDNRISIIPFWVEKLFSLTVLDLTRNRIKLVPATISHLTHLKELLLGSNPIREVPGDLQDLPRLEKAIVDIDRLRCVKRWRKDVHLYAQIARHGVTTAPSEIISSGEHALWLYMCVLHESRETGELDLSAKTFWKNRMEMPDRAFLHLPPPIVPPPPGVGVVAANGESVESGGNNAQERQLSNDETISGVATSSPLGMIHLRHLNLRGNRLTKLPPEIWFLQMLESLDLTDNDMREIPTEISRITTLERLILQGNRRLQVPSREVVALGMAPLISYLRAWLVAEKRGILEFSGQALDVFPREVARFTCIRSLNLSNNSIRTIPFDLCTSLATLTMLDVSRNSLTVLPQSIAVMTGLVELHLDRNFLLELPASFTCLSRLQVLSANQNLMFNVPQEISKRGAKYALEFLLRVSAARRSGVLDLSGLDISAVPSEMSAMAAPPGLRSTVLKPLLLWVQEQQDNKDRARQRMTKRERKERLRRLERLDVEIMEEEEEEEEDEWGEKGRRRGGLVGKLNAVEKEKERRGRRGDGDGEEEVKEEQEQQKDDLASPLEDFVIDDDDWTSVSSDGSMTIDLDWEGVTKEAAEKFVASELMLVPDSKKVFANVRTLSYFQEAARKWAETSPIAQSIFSSSSSKKPPTANRLTRKASGNNFRDMMQTVENDENNAASTSTQQHLRRRLETFAGSAISKSSLNLKGGNNSFISSPPPADTVVHHYPPPGMRAVRTRYLLEAMESTFGPMDVNEHGWFGVKNVQDRRPMIVEDRSEAALHRASFLGALEGVADVRNQGVADVLTDFQQEQEKLWEESGVFCEQVNDNSSNNESLLRKKTAGTAGTTREEANKMAMIWRAATQDLNVFTVLSMGRVTALTTLDLHANMITHIPSTIQNAQMGSVTSADFSFNLLSVVPAEMCCMTSLTNLSLAGNSLAKLPSAWSTLNRLISLDVRQNEMKKFPSVIGGWTNLTKLSINDNKLEVIPANIGSLTKLSELWMQNNNIADIAPSIRNLLLLKKLNLGGNNFETLPPFLCDLTSLEVLGLHKCRFSRLPPGIRFLPFLSVLTVHHNRLLSLQREFSDLRVKELKLHANRITEHRHVYGISTLTRLHLQDNCINEIPECISDLFDLSELWLQRNEIESLPFSLGLCYQLTDLRLSGNRLTTLPEQLSSLSSLKVLLADNNRLVRLAGGMMSGMTALEELWLDHNDLQAIPASISALSNLSIAHFDYNCLSSLPREMGTHCTSISELWLNNNILGTGYGIPDAILGMDKSLIRLTLSSNALTEIPPSISQLTRLEELWVQDNDISSLPFELAHLKRLRVLLSDLTSSTGQLTDTPPPPSEIFLDDRSSLRIKAKQAEIRRQRLAEEVKG